MKECVSLEISQRLKEKGWLQKETKHGWVWDEMPQGGYAGTADKPEPPEMAWMVETPFCPDEFGENCIAAPTIAELLEALPCEVTYQGKEFWLELSKNPGNDKHYYAAGYYTLESNNLYTFANDVNPANVLALLWLALKENKVL